MQEVVVIFKEPWYNENIQEDKKHSDRKYKQPSRRELQSITRENEGLQKLFGKQKSVDYSNLQAMRMRTISKDES